MESSANSSSSSSRPDGSCPKLLCFFLFNSTWGPREEDEDQKVVYFWPESTGMAARLRRIGLVEGVTRFMSKFSAAPAHSLHTQRERTAFFEVEPDYWLCLAVSLPFIRRPASNNTTAGGGNSNGSAEVIEFRPEDVSDAVLLALLRRAHAMFCLFHGGLARALERAGGERSQLTKWLDHFYSRYLTTLGVERADLVSEWGGIQYLALGAAEFLRVRALVNRVEEADAAVVRHSLFLQAGQLVWSGVGPEPTRYLFHYLSTSLLPSLPSLPSFRPSNGFFVVGGDSGDCLPTIYIGEATFHLAVFHAHSATLCLLLERPPPNGGKFYADFTDTIGPELSELSTDLTHAVVTKASGGFGASAAPPGGSGSGELVRFLYFNASNMAITRSLDENCGRDERLIRLAADLAADLRRAGQTEAAEATARLATEEWAVVQLAGARTIVFLLHDKNLNLTEVAEEVARLRRASFDNICML